MKQDRPSQTAYRVALSRAAHQLLDSPTVLQDPIALSMVGAQGAAQIRVGGRQFTSRFALSLRAFLVARSRYAEDALAQAVENGVRQYVILGAGFDTFAYRSADAAGALRVFEVDFPSTQARKRSQLDAAGIAVPANLSFVPMDFETQSLAGQLALAGFKADQPTFYSWLGVSMYLLPHTVMATLQDLASTSAVGSTIVFDYLTPIEEEPLFRRMHLRLLMGLLKVIGEPWRSFFEPKALCAKLKTMGFARADDLTPDAINAQYLQGRSDQLKVGGLGHVMIAKI
jgi:methyltransferase (TIGR00027 family)